MKRGRKADWDSSEAHWIGCWVVVSVVLELCWCWWSWWWWLSAEGAGGDEAEAVGARAK